MKDYYIWHGFGKTISKVRCETRLFDCGEPCDDSSHGQRYVLTGNDIRGTYIVNIHAFETLEEIERIFLRKEAMAMKRLIKKTLNARNNVEQISNGTYFTIEDKTAPTRLKGE